MKLEQDEDSAKNHPALGSDPDGRDVLQGAGMTIRGIGALNTLSSMIRNGAPIGACTAYLDGKLGRAAKLDPAAVERRRRAKARFGELAARARFTSDWFTPYVDAWMAAFARAGLADRRPDILEIGAWEGMSTLFLGACFEHSTITVVDTWAGGEDHSGSAALRDVEHRFDANVAPVGGRIKKAKGLSSEVLARLHAEQVRYDLIYIDGSHYADDVLVDALHSWGMLRRAGVLIFDDYLWQGYRHGSSNPGPAINLFLKHKRSQYRLLNVGSQVILQRLTDEADRHAMR
jgi:predicted O-methyltransferase YrrM